MIVNGFNFMVPASIILPVVVLELFDFDLHDDPYHYYNLLENNHHLYDHYHRSNPHCFLLMVVIIISL